MFDISFGEMLLVVVVAVVFIGPRELPTVIRAVAKGIKALKGLSNEMKKTFDDLAAESGIKETKEALHAEIKMIQGDDGNWYESYAHVIPTAVEGSKDPSTTLRSTQDDNV